MARCSHIEIRARCYETRLELTNEPQTPLLVIKRFAICFLVLACIGCSSAPVPDGASAVLTLRDGSTIYVYPGEIIIVDAEGNWAKRVPKGKR